MKRLLLGINCVIFLFFFLSYRAQAQTNQTFTNGTTTTPINFPGTGCIYNWTNSNPSIGLPASGTGNIPAFTAVNTGNTPVIANISATSASPGFAYIANSGSNNVSVINTANNTVVSTIAVGSQPYCLVVSPDGSRVYVANFQSQTVSIINTSTQTVIATLAAGIGTYGISISADGSKVYATNEISNTVSVINTATNTISSIPVDTDPTSVAISPDGSKIYVTGFNDGTVSVYNTSTSAIIATIPVDTDPYSLIMSPDGSRVYMLNNSSLTVINTSTNTVIAKISTGSNSIGVAISPDGSKLYVTNRNDNSVSVVNTAANAVTGTIAVGNGPQGISTSPDGSLLYVVNGTDGTVSVISTTTNAVINTVNVGQSPVSLGNFVSGCSPVAFTITVNPALPPPVITASTATGNISACQGSPSASPQLQEIKVSGSNLTTNVTATAPSGFEVSATQGSGYGNTATLTQTNGTVNNAIIYVRSSASARAGNILGSVVLSTTGAGNKNIAVTGTVNALPTVSRVGPQTVTNGQPTTAVNFTGTADGFTWTNDTPGIGLPASGTGNIASFTAINTGNSAITATITVTPKPASGFAYIANTNSGDVSVINAGTNTVVATIPAGSTPFGVSVSPDGSRVYVSNQGSNNVTVINAITNTVITTIPVNVDPSGIVVSPSGKRVYVVNYNYSNNVSVINTLTNTVIHTIPVGTFPMGIAVSPDGSHIYVTNLGDNTVSVIDASTNNVITTIPVGISPTEIAVSPDGANVYLSNQLSNSVSVISTVTNVITATIPVGTSPAGIAITPDGTRAYVVNRDDNTISIINTATNTVINTINIGELAAGISISPDGSRLYVTSERSNNVWVISTATNAVIGAVEVGSAPFSIGNFVTQGTGCSGTPVIFTITVSPTIASRIIATGSLSPLTTNYGTPSSSTIFTVSGNSLTAGILVTPPAGFEVSADDIRFSNSITVSGSSAETTVYVRLASTTPVGDNYSGNIILTSAGVSNIMVATARSAVNPDALTIIADNKSKIFGTDNPYFTVSYNGFVNNETAAQLTTPPLITTTATITSPIGKYPIIVSGGASPNYTFVYIPGTLNITPGELVVPNAFTPNGDGINDAWNIKYIENFPNCTVDIYNRYGEKLYSSIGYPIPWDGKYKGANLPVGTYYYIIDPKGGLKAVSGYVAIIR